MENVLQKYSNIVGHVYNKHGNLISQFQPGNCIPLKKFLFSKCAFVFLKSYSQFPHISFACQKDDLHYTISLFDYGVENC